MGFLSGALGQIGEQVRQKTLLDQSIEHQANQSLAQNLFQLGDQAMKEKPENAPDFYKAAYALQTTPLGKKPPKWATDIQGMLFKHRQAEMAPQMQEPPGPPQSGNMPDVPLDPNNPESGTLDGSFHQVHQDLAAQQQQAQQQQQIAQAQQQLQTQQQTAQAPPPVSGLPSPGFQSLTPYNSSGGVPLAQAQAQFEADMRNPGTISEAQRWGWNQDKAAKAGAAMPQPPGQYFPTLPGQPGGTSGFAGDVSGFPGSGIPGGQDFALFTPQERARAALASETAKFAAQYGIQNAAELSRMQSKAAFDKKLEKEAVADRINQLKTDIDPSTGKSIWDGLDANERANVEIDAKRIIPPRVAAAAASLGVQKLTPGETLMAPPPPGSPPGTPWTSVGSGIDKTPADRNVPVDQQAFKGYMDKAGGDPVKAFQLMEADKEKLKPAAQDIGTWSLQEDSAGKPILFNSKTAQTKPVTGMQKSGTKAKEDAATEKAIGPARDALAFAESYLSSGNFTGPSDEALQEKFFELAKPATGFRMTQPQMNMLMATRNLTGGAVARLKHLADPNAPYFDATQRKNIVQTMRDLANAKSALVKANGATSGMPAPPSGGKLTVDEARSYLQRAGGDKDKARALATADGRSF